MHSRELTLAELFRPQTVVHAGFYDAAVILCGSLIIALSAQISFWLPFSPVPVTGQTFAVLMAGALLGSGRGAASIIFYLLGGAAGLPVFAGGAAGIFWLIGPTGGYLAGFVAAAWTVGKLCEKGWGRKVITTIFAMTIGNILIYLFGVLWLGWLSAAAGLNVMGLLTAGIYPFVLGDIVKIILAAILLPSGWKLLSKNGLTA